MPKTRRATKLTESPTMANKALPNLPVDGAVAGHNNTNATSADKAPVIEVTDPVIDLTDNDAAMVKLFERLGALKGVASFFVLDQGIDSLAVIHDLDDDPTYLRENQRHSRLTLPYT